jgi:hypothetical protein
MTKTGLQSLQENEPFPVFEVPKAIEGSPSVLGNIIATNMLIVIAHKSIYLSSCRIIIGVSQRKIR